MQVSFFVVFFKEVTLGQLDKNGKGGKWSRPPKQQRTPRFNNVEFIQFELDTDQQAACKAWDVSPDDVFTLVEEMLSDGYKFTLKYDDRTNCYACFVFPPDDHPTNGGRALTGRGSNSWKGVKQVLWKHIMALQGDWSAYAGRDDRALLDD